MKGVGMLAEHARVAQLAWVVALAVVIKVGRVAAAAEGVVGAVVVPLSTVATLRAMSEAVDVTAEEGVSYSTAIAASRPPPEVSC